MDPSHKIERTKYVRSELQIVAIISEHINRRSHHTSPAQLTNDLPTNESDIPVVKQDVKLGFFTA
jgi:hypothetical protein